MEEEDERQICGRSVQVFTNERQDVFVAKMFGQRMGGIKIGCTEETCDGAFGYLGGRRALWRVIHYVRS